MGVKKKQSTAKGKPKLSTAKEKMQSILTAEIFLSLWGEALEPPVNDNGNTVEYLMGEMEAHDTKFNKQLIFWSGQKRKQSVLKVQGHGLWSLVVHDLDSDDDA